MNDEKYSQPLALFFSLFCYIIFIICSSLLLLNFIDLDVNKILAKAELFSIKDIEAFRPEPQEIRIFVLAMITLPIMIPFFYFLFIKIGGNYLNKKLYNFSCWSATLLCISLVLYSTNSSWGSSYFDYYLNKTVFNHITITLFIVFASIIFYSFLNIKPTFKPYKSSFLNLSNKLLKLIVVLIFITIFCINIFDVNAINNSTPYTTHLNAFYYSVVQVINGGSPLYVNGFSNTYGLYPHLLEPIFFFIGGVTIFKFSIVMAILIVLSYYMVFLVMSKLILNKFYLYSGFLSIFWFQYLSSKPVVEDFFFQYIPLRIIFPCLLIYIAYRYTEAEKKGLSFLVGSFIATLSILWNHDTGFVVVISWLLFTSFWLINKTEGLLSTFRVLARHLLVFLVVAFATLLTFYLYIGLRYGGEISVDTLFPLMEMFETLILHSSLGLGMEPMPIRHPWVILMTIYVTGFSYALINIKKKEEIQFNSIIFLLSSLGMGLFIYFLGRSINLNLLTVSLPGLILISLYGDLFYKRFFHRSLLHEKIFLFTITIFLCISIVNTIISWPSGFQSLVLDRNQILNLDKVTQVELNIAFIEKHTSTEEKVLILSGNQGVYHSETQTSSIFNIGTIDLFRREDLNKLRALIINGNIKIFLDKKTYPEILIGFKDRFYAEKELIRFIENSYKIVDKNDDLILMTSGGT
jgi:hypothetical protein